MTAVTTFFNFFVVEGILSEPVPASGGAKDGGGKNNNCSPPLLHERTVSEPAPSQVKLLSSNMKLYFVGLLIYVAKI